MSFYTALTGLNAATAQLGVTSNNIANVGTTGFKRSRADFGDIFATSPLQKASAVVGQGVSLKQVSQEFSQGNIQVSSNALDLAITGDGFFPLKSADGLQDIYTRNGSFTMNDQYNVVNSAGQALMAASVDSSGKADLGNLNRLSIPKKTSGDARQTSLVQLGLNFPADAKVVTDAFNRNNPATYNKTTAITVYDQGGNGYLATVYYAKTQNASQASPNNKWQTYVYIGDTLVSAALIQATDSNSEKLYVNKYGELAPYSQVAEKLVNKKTQAFHLDDLTDKRDSVPAAVTGDKVVDYNLDASHGINFSSLTDVQKLGLKTMFQVDIDGSGMPVTMDMSKLANYDGLMNGTAIAKAMTNELNRQFGSAKYFNFDSDQAKMFTLSLGGVDTNINLDDLADPEIHTIDLATTSGTSVAGTLTVAGQEISISAGLTDDEVATAVRSAMMTTGSTFLTAHPGASIAVSSNTLTITYDKNDASHPTADALEEVSFTPTDSTETDEITGDVAVSQELSAPDLVSKHRITFGASSATGTLTIAGQEITIASGLDGAGVAEAVQTALSASGSDFLTAYPGASVNWTSGDDYITISYDMSDKEQALETIRDGDADGASKTGVSATAYVEQKYLGDYDKLTTDDAVTLLQKGINMALNGDASTTGRITVSYDPVAQGFKFIDSTKGEDVSIRGGGVTAEANSVLGLSAAGTDIAADGSYVATGDTTPNGSAIREITKNLITGVETNPQRYGLKVDFDSVNQKFTIKSGTTGDNSSISVTNISSLAKSILGMTFTDVNPSAIGTSSDALRGIASKPAVTLGTPIAINVNNNFPVDETNNRFIVTVDDVKGEVVLPPNPNYTLDSFIAALQGRINTLANDTGSTVNGVKVEYDRASNALKFTSGTANSDSFIKVSSQAPVWGLLDVAAGRGQTTTWIKPTQFTDYATGRPVKVYIDDKGAETSSAEGYTSLPEWSPVYLDKGELTFNTAGNLISPRTGAQLDTVFLPDGKGSLRINIDYSKSTQYSSAFAVLSQSQDGAPEGDLVGVNIGDDGLVNASYSNGSQRSLGKIVLVNFSNPNGLRQIGDSSFYSSSSSGAAKYGEAGGAGFGTIRAGARERANVDLTQELVDLITAQRNFQANAKAIETNTAITQSIIQIRA